MGCIEGTSLIQHDSLVSKSAPDNGQSNTVSLPSAFGGFASNLQLVASLEGHVLQSKHLSRKIKIEKANKLSSINVNGL